MLECAVVLSGNFRKPMHIEVFIQTYIYNFRCKVAKLTNIELYLGTTYVIYTIIPFNTMIV